MAEFIELQDEVISYSDVAIIYFEYKSRPHLAFYLDRFKYMGKLLSRLGLMYDIEHGARVGFYRISRGMHYYEKFCNFNVIKPLRSKNH